MQRITVKIGKGYDIVVGRGILSSLGNEIRQIASSEKIMVVSDENVAPLYLVGVRKSLLDSGYRVYDIVLKSGEKEKTLEAVLKIVTELAINGFGRNDLVVALGGGVVGDTAGFAAAVYMRGIAVVQVPTTLLAAIDSSIGGKTGVDLDCGKNLIGAFHQPILTLCDVALFESLPKREWLCGLGEAIKYSVLAGGEILELLIQGVTEDNVEKLVSLCAEYKARIVEADERECGNRALLNLGHTIGHAIEKLSGYDIPHGEGVVKGIAVMLVNAYDKREITSKEYAVITSLIEKYGYDLTVNYSVRQLLTAIKLDKKKTKGDSLRLVEIKGIGRCVVVERPLEVLGEYIEDYIDE